MSDDFHQVRPIKKTRKPHPCFGCQKIIPSGSPAFYHSCVFEGDFSADYFCEPCHAYYEAHPEEASEGFYSGDIGQLRKEEES